MRVIIAAAMFAAALVASSSAFAQTMGKSDPYCLKTSAGAMDCAYKTMAECNKAKTGGSDSCMKNPGGGKK